MTLARRAAWFVAAWAAGGFAPAAVQAQPLAYTFDPSHSFITFELLHFDTSTLRGRFGPLQGQVVLDRAARNGRVDVRVELASVSTGLAFLDNRLRQADFLDVAGAPQAFFIATHLGFDADGGVASVRGEFTLRGQSRPLALSAQRFRCYLSPVYGREVCGGDFVGEIKRSDFGITHSLPFVSDRVRLQLQVEAVREP